MTPTLSTATANHTTTSTDAPSSCNTDTAVTKSLLAYGVIAGPIYLAVVAVQALTRDGFDMSRHAASLLSNGDLGWIQIATFIVTGLMSVAAAVGMRRAISAGRGRTWGPRLVGLWGAGLIAAGLFRADPMDGFPVGTPEAASAVSWHGALHMVSAGVGFFALIAACIVFARRFAAEGKRGRAAYSAITGVFFFASFAGLASGSHSAAGVLAFWAAVVMAWAWLSMVSLHLYQVTARLQN